MKAKFLPSIALGTICFVVAAILALVNEFTEPKIAQNKLDAINESLTEVLEGHSGFETVEITGEIPSSIQLIKKSREGGYVFTAVTTGKSAGLTVLIGIDSDGKIAGTKCTAHNETPSYAENVFKKTETGLYDGLGLDNVDSFYQPPFKVTSATYTSNAYADAVKDALVAFSILEGGNQ